MAKEFIQNRKGQKIAVLIDEASPQKGLAFVMHGLSGSKEQPHIKTFADAFSNNGYTVVRFDTTNTFGESDGSYEDATTTNYYEDLEDVIAWAGKQSWYQEPFCLAGHSLGGICTALFAERYPEKIKGLAPISTVVSGAMSMESNAERGRLDAWRSTGWLVIPSESSPGVMKRLKWSHMEDRLKYDLLPEAASLTMPVLLIVGDQDASTPLAHHKPLFEALPGRKELHVIPEGPHTFKNPEQLRQIRNIFDKWIKSLS